MRRQNRLRVAVVLATIAIMAATCAGHAVQAQDRGSRYVRPAGHATEVAQQRYRQPAYRPADVIQLATATPKPTATRGGSGNTATRR